ncbi:hypothetical protein HF086_001172 [Spodoptera exigua]|uniref:Uncharacterized protein n=1 Tax=Spodoptera exigua TaxID=7107 RepID=A0A922SC42_SPOEX|nr:hypothetical protein HF086_001172 [Spodoptera exigua]
MLYLLCISIRPLCNRVLRYFEPPANTGGHRERSDSYSYERKRWQVLARRGRSALDEEYHRVAASGNERLPREYHDYGPEYTRERAQPAHAGAATTRTATTTRADTRDVGRLAGMSMGASTRATSGAAIRPAGRLSVIAPRA